MAGLGQTQRVNIANAVLRNTAYTSPGATIFVSLHTGDPGVDGQTTANEVSTGGGSAYIRQGVTFSAPSAATPNSVTTSSNGQTFAAAGTSWGTITHFALWNHVSNNAIANFIGAQTLTGGSQSIGVGNIASFASGAITLTISG